MLSGYKALTEKEKATLRLILCDPSVRNCQLALEAALSQYVDGSQPGQPTEIF